MNIENYNVDIQELFEFILTRIALTDARITILSAQVSAFLQYQHPDFVEKTSTVAPKLEEVGAEHLRLMLEGLSLQSQEMKGMIVALMQKSQ